MPGSNVDFLFAVFETQRLLRLYADKQARRYGLTRAQWAVLAKLERVEGQKQAELADLMEMAPITLTRLIDKLCNCGMVERRSDDNDRRVNRLYLTDAARPLLAKLTALRNEITQTALAGLSADEVRRLVGQLETVKDNVREAVQAAGQTPKTPTPPFKEASHG
ncbi:MarR family winged helix-turn-helix transcriptional regulator [Tardiphaga sp.]|uniref:MarR family winged helix-turn-helix transcriptional regulator n=1 Tax=Tardiphaga sp. TaxID=1926292 RepID=UPI002627FE5E|nr:MarR family winged helix-turn-helix transcriptional regulator [Tardiphaga sp.]MDB5619103.1 transcriptional regulator, MarR family [Tardiphaga sp.]